MATVRTSAAGGGTAGTSDRTVAITTVAGDLLVVFACVAVNTNASPTCSDTGDGTSTYTRITTALKNSSGDMVSAFVRNGKVATGAATTVTVATGSNTSGEIVAVAIAGMSKVGASAILQSVAVANQAAGGTPAATFSASAKFGNLMLGAVGHTKATADATAPSGASPTWTELQDTGQSTPATGLEVVSTNLGFSSGTITWGGTTSTAYGVIAVEVDASITPAVATLTLTGVAPPVGLGLVPVAGAVTAAGGVAASYICTTPIRPNVA